ncbi:hypothetical protein SAMN06295967_12122 [Belliella buryatensis]|uniref:Uncharacterized protein n=1 Tax=Belliella buryatensis TaxID=1500549 RepID=A0A239H0E1_9BACT|nr:hypothetical protein [Belliella buryatensis]SNS74631.1 hypothetical protein SAMN06295967_12122 [Belliella buryatensis]
MNTIQEINKRWNAPTPRIFQKIRNIGLILVTIAGAILAIPEIVPELIVTAAGYALAVGSSLSVIAQATSEEPIPPVLKSKSRQPKPKE